MSNITLIVDLRDNVILHKTTFQDRIIIILSHSHTKTENIKLIKIIISIRSCLMIEYIDIYLFQENKITARNSELYISS